MRHQRAVALFGAAALVTIMVLSGCGDNPLTPEQVVGGNDTVFVVNPPDTSHGGGRDTVVIITPCDTCRTDTVIIRSRNCGEINTGAFNVTRSTPQKYLLFYYFSAPVMGNVFIRIDNYREGGGHTNQDILIYAVRDGDGMKVVIARPGDPCGVLADTTGVDTPVTRYVGAFTLPAGTWSFYALHGSQVSCWTQSGSGNGPVNVVDAQIDFCY